MDAKGNCKPLWHFLTLQHAAASTTAALAPFSSAAKNSFYSKADKTGKITIAAPLAVPQGSYCSGRTAGSTEVQAGLPSAPPRKAEEKEVSGAMSLCGGTPCQTTTEDQASSY